MNAGQSGYFQELLAINFEPKGFLSDYYPEPESKIFFSVLNYSLNYPRYQRQLA